MICLITLAVILVVHVGIILELEVILERNTCFGQSDKLHLHLFIYLIFKWLL